VNFEPTENDLRFLPDDVETASRRLSGSRCSDKRLYLVPVVAALSGLTTCTYFELLGPGLAMQIAWFILMGSIGWRLLYFMESVDQPVGNEPAPNPKVP